MVVEKVKLTNGQEHEIEVKSVGALTSNNILDEHFKLNGITNTSEGSTIDLKGTSMFKIQNAFLQKGISGIDNIDDIDPEDAGRIYEKYYSRIVRIALGTLGGSPK